MNASGRDDTALANAILNGFAMLLSATAAWYNIPLVNVTPEMADHFGREIAKISICGDDALGFLPSLSAVQRQAFVARLRANLQTFGFVAKAFASDRFHDAVYLGHRPLIVSGKWVWGRTIGRCIYKLGWQSEIKGDPCAYMTGVMDMHLSCNPHVPIVADLARCFNRHREGLKRTPVIKDPHKPWEWMSENLRLPPYDEDTLRCVAEAYSVRRDATRGDLVAAETAMTVSDVKEAIAHIHKTLTSSQATVLDHWVLRQMVWLDEQ